MLARLSARQLAAQNGDESHWGVGCTAETPLIVQNEVYDIIKPIIATAEQDHGDSGDDTHEEL